jgi:diguanylate cyclase
VENSLHLRLRGERDRRPLRQFLAFAVVSLLPVAALGGLLVRTFESEVDRLVLVEAGQQGSAMIGSTIESMVGEVPFAKGLTATSAGSSQAHRVSEIRAASAAMMRSGSVLRFRLRGLDGSIVFDADKPQNLVITPGNEHEAEEIGEAIAEGGLHMLARLDSDTVDGATTLGARAIESYEPVLSPTGTPIGVAELYLPYEPIAREVQVSQNRMITRTLLGLLGLWIVLGWIVRATTKRFRRAAEHHLYVSRHDVLTNLPNRVAFREACETAVKRASAQGSSTAIAIIDLNGFKEINDTLGHHNGDEFLRHVSKSLAKVTQGRGMVARLGGDEFGLVVDECGVDDVAELGAAISAVLRAEISLDDVPVGAEASVGVALWPGDGDGVEELIRNADLAMYAAKRSRAGLVAYHTDLAHFSFERLGLVSEFRAAIGNNELVLHYQPKIVLASGRVECVEALVRWAHPTRGLLQPAQFLEVVESSMLIDDLSAWVIRRAIRQLAEWGHSPFAPKIAVNLSARNVRNDSIVKLIKAELAANHVNPSRLLVEITETDFLDDPRNGQTVLQALRDSGVEASLDDFGQGYTSLAHLTTLPVSELKIDRSFVSTMISEPRSAAVVESVIALGHKLGLSVIAEGVETVEELDALRALGCDAVQGFYFSRAVPPERVEEWLRSGKVMSLNLDAASDSSLGPSPEKVSAPAYSR